MKLLNFNIIKLTLFLILGIIFSYVNPISIKLSLLLLGICSIGLGVSYFFQKNKLKQLSAFGVLVLITIFLVGISIYSLNDDKNCNHHYTNMKISSTDKVLQVKICERLKPSLYHNKYIVELLRIDTIAVSGKLLLNVTKDSLAKPYKVDAKLTGNMKIDALPKPLNPYQFNYKNYLNKKHIYGQLYVEEKDLILQEQTTTSIYGYANSIRDFINNKLENYSFSKKNLAMINALLLGQRQHISKETYDNYKNAGVVHILAISGLHIGIILLILNWIFHPISYLKHGRVLKTTLLVGILWTFAVISGLSPSVTRAVSMFTVIAIAINFKRPTNIYNTLAISAFIILLIKPMFIFEVGFQLSYLAVLGIVSMQPKLYKRWSLPKKFWVTNKLWEVFTVTIAAQLAILPLSLFYFHQFPGLFFITNLLLVPCLGIILFFGILVIICASVNVLPEILVIIYNGILNLMNLFVDWVASKEQFLFKNISFTWQELIVWYVLLITIILYLNYRSFKRLKLVLFSVIILQATLLFIKANQNNTELVIFHRNKETILVEKLGGNAIFYQNSDTTHNSLIVNNYVTGSSIKNTKFKKLKPYYHFNRNHILIIDSLGLYNFKSFTPNYILLTNSPKINLERLLDSLQPKALIANGSNYKTYVKRWKETCIKRKIPFHYTGEKGAYIFK